MPLSFIVKNTVLKEKDGQVFKVIKEIILGKLVCFVTFIDLVAGGWLWLVVGCDTRPKSGDAQRKLMRFQCEYNFSRRNSIYKYLARERRGINILPTNHRWCWWWCWWWCVDGSCLSLDFSQLLLLRRRLVGWSHPKARDRWMKISTRFNCVECQQPRRQAFRGSNECGSLSRAVACWQ